MRRLPFSTPLFALLAALLPAASGAGCGSGSSSGATIEAPPAAATPTATTSTNTTPARAARGGITYDPAAPLNADVRATFDSTNPPSLSYTYTVKYTGGDNARVPGLLSIPVNRTGKVPCVILLHGLGGRKEDVFLLGVALARKGYASIAIDIAGHGERPKIGGKPVSELSVAEMRTLIGQTDADLRRAVDFLASREEIDGGRIGFLGASLGGIIGGLFTGDEPRIKGAVLWAAGGDWGKLITTSQHAFAQHFREIGATDATTIENTMHDVDPLTTIAGISPRPLLFINGDADNIVPPATTDLLFAAAREPKKRITLHGGHIPDIGQMITLSLDWLDANVK